MKPPEGGRKDGQAFEDQKVHSRGIDRYRYSSDLRFHRGLRERSLFASAVHILQCLRDCYGACWKKDREGDVRMRYYESQIIERIGFDFYCDIANNIVKARKGKGWTQAELAKKTGMKEASISNIECVKKRVKLEELEKLAKKLDTTVNWLIDAELDSQVGECLYLIWLEDDECFKLYQESTSKRLAYLEFEKKLNSSGLSLTSFVNPRVRVFVKLVGVPVRNKELSDHFPKLGAEDNEKLPHK